MINKQIVFENEKWHSPKVLKYFWLKFERRSPGPGFSKGLIWIKLIRI